MLLSSQELILKYTCFAGHTKADLVFESKASHVLSAITQKRRTSYQHFKPKQAECIKSAMSDVGQNCCISDRLWKIINI
jgi:hypothetical protein